MIFSDFVNKDSNHEVLIVWKLNTLRIKNKKVLTFSMWPFVGRPYISLLRKGVFLSIFLLVS
jgi:hypothetical protein